MLRVCLLTCFHLSIAQSHLHIGPSVALCWPSYHSNILLLLLTHVLVDQRHWVLLVSCQCSPAGGLTILPSCADNVHCSDHPRLLRTDCLDRLHVLLSAGLYIARHIPLADIQWVSLRQYALATSKKALSLRLCLGCHVGWKCCSCDCVMMRFPAIGLQVIVTACMNGVLPDPVCFKLTFKCFLK